MEGEKGGKAMKEAEVRRPPGKGSGIKSLPEEGWEIGGVRGEGAGRREEARGKNNHVNG